MDRKSSEVSRQGRTPKTQACTEAEGRGGGGGAAGRALGIEVRALQAGFLTLAIDAAVWEPSNLEEKSQRWRGGGQKKQNELNETA